VRIIALALALTIWSTFLAAQSPSGYRITHTYTLGGDGSWDYVVPDPPNHRLFIARQNRVMVVDENDGRLIGEVTGIQGAHGTAIAESSGRGFATSGNDQSVVMFDLKTFNVLGRIPAAEDADAIIYDRASNRVFTFNGDAHSSTVIDPQAGTRITNLPLGGKPEYGASAGDGKVYANLTDTSEVVEIDAKGLAVTRRWSTGACKQPVSMALDVAHHRLFSGCRSGVMAISDYQVGKVVATVPIGSGGRRRLRSGFRQRVRLQRRRHAYRDSSGRSRSISRRRKRADARGVTQHGTRSNQSPRVCGVRKVRLRTGHGQRQSAGAARFIFVDGDRTRSGRSLTV
jgi:hypothetical protein